ncbi:MAG: PIG-L family deacetylase [Deltaproteobacteria bacterium]|nr:PIG-L family deacetylase [Deltaproteobacteria bacterium]MBW2063927.1 PIG-L family deacetylase [Deltaproteobacteria bacterium]
MNTERVLILAPHTDDGEFGCGGSIAKFIESGAMVYYATFSLCEESIPKGLPKDILEKEVVKASEVWGIGKSNLLIFRYPVRRFAEHRQDILEDLVELQRDLKPTTVFVPSFNDLHQDHHIVAQEGMRAFKKTTVLAYEMPWNNITFSTQLFIKLSSEHIDKKLAALREYRSQKEKPYANEEFIRSLARMRGVSIDASYAEAFEVVRWIIE